MSYLKITGGNLKGRKLYVPSFIRPTQNKVKKAIFDILGNYVSGSVFLDLFAGSGNVGIEALSRGAKLCVFVEKNPRCISIIKKNIHELRLQEKSKIIKEDSEKFALKQNNKFDIIFADPPYNYLLKRKFIENVIKLLNKGIFVLEVTKRKKFDEFSDLIKREEIYGETKILFFGNISW